MAERSSELQWKQIGFDGNNYFPQYDGFSIEYDTEDKLDSMDTVSPTKATTIFDDAQQS